jgi:hypothetical protein
MWMLLFSETLRCDQRCLGYMAGRLFPFLLDTSLVDLGFGALLISCRQ